MRCNIHYITYRNTLNHLYSRITYNQNWMASYFLNDMYEKSKQPKIQWYQQLTMRLHKVIQKDFDIS